VALPGGDRQECQTPNRKICTEPVRHINELTNMWCCSGNTAPVWLSFWFTKTMDNIYLLWICMHIYDMRNAAKCLSSHFLCSKRYTQTLNSCLKLGRHLRDLSNMRRWPRTSFAVSLACTGSTNTQTTSISFAVTQTQPCTCQLMTMTIMTPHMWQCKLARGADSPHHEA